VILHRGVQIYGVEFTRGDDSDGVSVTDRGKEFVYGVKAARICELRLVEPTSLTPAPECCCDIRLSNSALIGSGSIQAGNLCGIGIEAYDFNLIAEVRPMVGRTAACAHVDHDKRRLVQQSTIPDRLGETRLKVGAEH
jgi:hypothetical protein